MNFAQNLAAARKDLNLSQEALAQQVKVSVQTIEQWEASESYPQMDEMKQLSRTLKRDAENMLADNEMNHYIDLALMGSATGSGSMLGDMLLVGGVIVGLIPGFFSGDFSVGIIGAFCGAVVGIVLRKICSKKKKKA